MVNASATAVGCGSLFAVLLASACAAVDPEAASVAPLPYATHWQTLAGGWIAPARQPGSPPPKMQWMSLGHPCGIAVRGDLVFIADCAAGELLRYDRTRDTIEVLHASMGAAPVPPVPVHVTAELASFVANPAEGVVTGQDADGRRVRRYADDANPGQPVAVAFDESRGELLIADALRRRVLVFGPDGELRRSLGGPPRADFRGIAAMALGPGGVYVLDRDAQQVVVLRPDGDTIEAFGDGSLGAPALVAVDRAGRVFVVDESDQTISLYVGGENVGRIGGRGDGAGRFGAITGVAVDDRMLFVADGDRARVQVLLLTPEPMRAAGAR